MFIQEFPPRLPGRCTLPRFLLLYLAVALTAGLRAEVFYWDADAGDGVGGSGVWDRESSLWRPGSPSVSATFWPGHGGNNDAYLHGSQGTITLGAPIQVNDLFVAPTSGLSFFVSGEEHVLSLIGEQASQIDIAPSAILTIRSPLEGVAGLIKTGVGRLAIDNFGNNLTGPVIVEGGTLQIGGTFFNSSTAALRSTPVHLEAGGTLTMEGNGGSLRIGTLSGNGTVSVTGKTLHIANLGAADLRAMHSATTYFASGPVFEGVLSIGSITVSGAGGTEVMLPGGSVFSMMTLSGDMRDMLAAMTVGAGAALTLTGTGSAAKGVSNAGPINLRGGALIFDSYGGNPSGGRRVAASAQFSFISGTLVFIGSPTIASNTSTGQVRLNSGASTITVIQPGSVATTLTISNIDRGAQSLRSTVDFRGEGGVLGSAGNNPRITIYGIATGAQEPWMTVNGSTYATYDTNLGVRPASLSTMVAAPTGTGNANSYFGLTGNAELGASSYSVKGLRILPSENGQALVLGGTGDLVTGGILLAGDRDFTISSTASGGLRHTLPRYIGVAEAGTKLTIAAPIKSPGQDVVKYGQGILHLTADNSATLTSGMTRFVINAGVLRVSLGPNGSLPSSGNTALMLRGGILEIVNGTDGVGAAADFQFDLGDSSGRVNWSPSTFATVDDGSGGFAAFGQNATVNIGALAQPSTLVWETGFFVRNGQSLHLNSATADRRITLLNNIALDAGSSTADYFAREIRVADNPNSETDRARIAGVISGGRNTDFLKSGHGTLELTGANTFQGNTIVQQGVLQLGASDGSGAGAAGAISGSRKIMVKSHVVNTGGKLVATNRATLRLGGDVAVTDRIRDDAQLVLEGGIFDANGRSETLGILSILHVDSILDLGAASDHEGNQVIRFAASHEVSWTGALQIWNWNGDPDGGGLDQVYFGLAIGHLRPDQLALISFFSDEGESFLGTAGQLATGEIVPAVPEPRAGATLLSALWFTGARGRRLARTHER